MCQKPARREAGRAWAVGSWACVVGLFGFGEVCLDVFRLDVVEVAGAGIDGETDEPAEEDVAPDPAGDGMGESSAVGLIAGLGEHDGVLLVAVELEGGGGDALEFAVDGDVGAGGVGCNAHFLGAALDDAAAGGSEGGDGNGH